MEKIYLETHSGKTLILEVENFDSVQFNKDQNNPEINSIEIGGVTRSRVDIKGATPEKIYLDSINNL
jgi:hypothetical protein